MGKNNRVSILENLALVTQIGVSMATPIIAGIFIGNLIDKKLNTGILFLIILTIVGVIISFRTLFKITTRGIKKK
ncbi:AtpZ/AtpI family protein [Clostridiisalibacter paucivorans]|uniref:AtpZ/AtpI family protein n=1 Tax=Clostridiisalibacter paucivorans TaxID=408753 RepID=UPI00047DC8AF|nr:AtpZ/AtpI family protein [Clostridiisalibacter paucivorans]